MGRDAPASSIPSIWLAQALAEDPTETTFAVLIYLCLFDISRQPASRLWSGGCLRVDSPTLSQKNSMGYNRNSMFS